MTQRTPAQIAASRNNGAQSRGPATPDGKQRSAQNSLKHGLTARRVTIAGEDVTQWNALRDSYFETFQPVGLAEMELVDAAAACSWRLLRCASVEAGAIQSAMTHRRRLGAISGMASESAESSSEELGAAFMDFDAHGFLTRSLTRYETRLARQRRAHIALLLEFQRWRHVRERREQAPECQCASNLDDQAVQSAAILRLGVESIQPVDCSDRRKGPSPCDIPIDVTGKAEAVPPRIGRQSENDETNPRPEVEVAEDSIE